MSTLRVDTIANTAGTTNNRVLQVVQGSVTTSSTTTSTTYQQSLLTASITPTNATSKILVLFTTTCVQTTFGSQLGLTIYRNNTTNLGGGTFSSLSACDNQNSGGYVWVPASGNVLDTPLTTSATSYTLYFKVQTAGTAVVNWNVNKATITLMEIAG
jgi:hypothetical protein